MLKGGENGEWVRVVYEEEVFVGVDFVSYGVRCSPQFELLSILFYSSLSELEYV